MGASRVPSVASHVPSVGQGPDDVGKSNCAGNEMKEKICDSGNHHEVLSFSETVDGEKPVLGVESFNGTPITKEKLLSLEINWAVFDHRLTPSCFFISIYSVSPACSVHLVLHKWISLY